MSNTERNSIKVGSKVKFVLKKDQRSNKLSEGIVAKILTNSSYHPHGIKIMTEDGRVGRVQEIME